MWIQGPLYTVLWLTSGQHRLDDSTFDAISRLWRHTLETRNFAYPALVPGSAYHNWSIYYFALTLLKQRGSPKIAEVRATFDRLTERHDETGTYAFLRGIDIVGAELSSMYPDALRLVHATIADLLNNSNGISGAHLDRLASSLERIRVLSYDEVEAILESIQDRSKREMVRKRMAAIRQGKHATTFNIGTLASVGGQDFYLHAMAEKNLRLLLAELMELLVSERTIGRFVSKGIKRLQKALQDS
jgi:hypothetical protein